MQSLCRAGVERVQYIYTGVLGARDCFVCCTDDMLRVMPRAYMPVATP